MTRSTKDSDQVAIPTIITLAPDADGIHVKAATSRKLSKSLAGSHFDSVNTAMIEIKKSARGTSLFFRVLDSAPAHN